jgi:hypothetical protein
MAKEWLGATAEVWTEQFAIVGDKDGHTLLVDGPGDTFFYATGRENVKKADIHMKVCF